MNNNRNEVIANLVIFNKRSALSGNRPPGFKKTRRSDFRGSGSLNKRSAVSRNRPPVFENNGNTWFRALGDPGHTLVGFSQTSCVFLREEGEVQKLS